MQRERNLEKKVIKVLEEKNKLSLGSYQVCKYETGIY